MIVTNPIAGLRRRKAREMMSEKSGGVLMEASERLREALERAKEAIAIADDTASNRPPDEKAARKKAAADFWGENRSPEEVEADDKFMLGCLVNRFLELAPIRERQRQRGNHRQRQRRLADPALRLKHSLRTDLGHAMKVYGPGKTKSAAEYGVDYSAIIETLGRAPSPDHVKDHIMPCAAFDHGDEAQIQACWDPRNFQWLTESENAAKNDFWTERSQAVAQELLADHLCLAAIMERAEAATGICGGVPRARDFTLETDQCSPSK